MVYCDTSDAGTLIIFDYMFFKTRTITTCRTFRSNKTLHQVRMHYYWPGLPVYVKDYWKSCITCSHTKPMHHKPYGLLKQLPIPDKPWNLISMDFHIEASSILQLYLNSSHCWLALQAVIIHPDSQYHYIPATRAIIHSTRLLQAQYPKPCHFRPRIRICIPLLPIPQNCTRHETSFHLGISSWRRQSNWTNESDSRKISLSLLQLPAGQLVWTPSISWVHL